MCKAEEVPRACFNGGIKSYDFELIMELHHLYNKEHHKMYTNWRLWKTFEDVETFAQNTQDVELLDKLKIVKMYKDDIPTFIEKITKCCPDSRPYEIIDYVFTTTHKAKGMQWKTVILLDDFLEQTKEDPQDPKDMPIEEKNLIYVALTRARKYLVYNKYLIHLLFSQGYAFEKIDHFKSLKEDAKCRETGREIKAHKNALGLTTAPNAKFMNLPQGPIDNMCSSLVTIKESESGKEYKSTTRQFLRYVVGVTNDKVEEAKEKLKEEAEKETVVHVPQDDKDDDDDNDLKINKMIRSPEQEPASTAAMEEDDDDDDIEDFVDDNDIDEEESSSSSDSGGKKYQCSYFRPP